MEFEKELKEWHQLLETSSRMITYQGHRILSLLEENMNLRAEIKILISENESLKNSSNLADDAPY